MTPVALVLSLILAQPAMDAPQALARFEKAQMHMGTLVAISLYAKDSETAERAFAAAYGRIAAVDRAMSDYDSSSEVSQLSLASPTTEPIHVSDDLWRVLVAAQRLSERTDGAFDVTIGTVSRLWRRARRQKQMPDAEQLAQARAAVGYNAIQLHGDTHSVQLTKSEMRIDLGGIAKGYAVDAALAALHENGVDRALVNAGGDLAASNPPPGSEYWTVGVRALTRVGEPTHFVRLANRAVATSGDAWQYVEIDGVRYSHIIDPKTGLGLTERSGVTIVAADCTTADSYASAVSVLGPVAGMKLIESTCGVEGMIATIENGQPHLQLSRGMDSWLAPAAQATKAE